MNFLKTTILDRFIFKQVFQATFVCLLLFIIVWIAPETLVRIIKEILTHQVTILGGVKELLYELPKVLGKAIPVGILLGSLFTFDKLSKDSELTILRGVGLSFTRIMAPVLVLGVILAMFCFYVSDKLIPLASIADKDNANYNDHFVYIVKDKNERPLQGIIVSNFTATGIWNLIVVNFSKEKYADASTFSSIVFAPTAIKKDNKWVLFSPKQYMIDKSGIYKNIVNLPTYEILQGPLSNSVYELMQNSTRKDRTFTNFEMLKYVKLLKKYNYTDEHNFFLAKFYQRFLHPLTCILFAAIGCLLGFAPPRSQRLVGFTIGVGMIFAYYITLPFFDLLAQKGVLAPFLASALPILVFVVSIFVIKKVKDL